LILIEDTRQQEGKHKNVYQYCQRHNIEIVRQKLDVGDYMLGERQEDGTVIPVGNISCDSKVDLLELCKDTMSSDHRRFRAECIRGQETGIQLFILVEEIPPFGRVDLWEVPKWRTSNEWHRAGEPMTLADPRTFKKVLKTMTIKYGVQFRFCTRRQSPQRIMKYLKGEYK